MPNPALSRGLSSVGRNPDAVATPSILKEGPAVADLVGKHPADGSSSRPHLRPEILGRIPRGREAQVVKAGRLHNPGNQHLHRTERSHPPIGHETVDGTRQSIQKRHHPHQLSPGAIPPGQ